MSDLPASVDTREIVIAGITLRMHYLNDGRRVIEAQGMNDFIRLAQAGRISWRDAARVTQWSKGDA